MEVDAVRVPQKESRRLPEPSDRKGKEFLAPEIP